MRHSGRRLIRATLRANVSSIDTPLSSRAPRPDAVAAFRLARGRFRDGRRVDLRDLVTELGVSRATLHRWVGSRDHLLGEILWAETAAVLDNVSFTGRGGEGIAEAIGTFVHTVNGSAPFRAFLRREPERALRLLTTKASLVQSRTIDKLRTLLSGEITAGRLSTPLPAADLAYLLVRVGESFIYTDVITGDEPDAAKAHTAARMLLGAHFRDATTAS
ncbi:QsdR family transcriptional regulator [Amycolatopsis jiangsuensis]|uniref:AcrR family transcriptional regulator n=1 Tax=Amycolatopsis jiangsuensis TaxID=1181879 RepID=A0A840J494_9PSEU|nr:QsdR family transcriptional regulator [Amycolatopsis jiangsuensis]MBB4688257.1 AcrR family transcriptional regulator [Amycolatopsis jiangsuensis]